jgi:hypothetical protein
MSFSVFLFFLTVCCLAENSPSIVLYVQGGETTISNGSDGTYNVDVKEVVPYSYFADGPVSHLIMVEKLINLPYPLKAALDFTNSDGESSSIVDISNISYSGKDNNLILRIKPIPFYDGVVLSNYKNDFDWKNNTEVTSTDIGIYMELPLKPSVDSTGQSDVPDTMLALLTALK